VLVPHAVDIHVHSWNLSNYYLTAGMFHICRTIHIFLFVKSSCALVSGNTNKSLRPKEWRIDRPTDRPSEWIRTRSLNSYFAFLQNSRKIKHLQCMDFSTSFGWNATCSFLQSSAQSLAFAIMHLFMYTWVTGTLRIKLLAQFQENEAMTLSWTLNLDNSVQRQVR